MCSDVRKQKNATSKYAPAKGIRHVYETFLRYDVSVFPGYDLGKILRQHL